MRGMGKESGHAFLFKAAMHTVNVGWVGKEGLKSQGSKGSERWHTSGLWGALAAPVCGGLGGRSGLGQNKAG